MSFRLGYKCALSRPAPRAPSSWAPQDRGSIVGVWGGQVCGGGNGERTQWGEEPARPPAPPVPQPLLRRVLNPAEMRLVAQHMSFSFSLRCPAEHLNGGRVLDLESSLLTALGNVHSLGISSTAGKASSDSCRSTSEPAIFLGVETLMGLVAGVFLQQQKGVPGRSVLSSVFCLLG